MRPPPKAATHTCPRRSPSSRQPLAGKRTDGSTCGTLSSVSLRMTELESVTQRAPEASSARLCTFLSGFTSSNALFERRYTPADVPTHSVPPRSSNTANASAAGYPSAFPTVVHRPSPKRNKPRRDAAHTTPCRSSSMPLTPGGAPCCGPKRVRCPFSMRTMPPPPPKPIHRLPSWAPTSACTGPVGSGSFSLSTAQETNCEPSKRRSPVGVPSHRYPSASWLTAKTSPGGSPFSEAHTDIA